jgi:hypothetical protein
MSDAKKLSLSNGYAGNEGIHTHIHNEEAAWGGAHKSTSGDTLYRRDNETIKRYIIPIYVYTSPAIGILSPDKPNDDQTGPSHNSQRR